VLRSCGDTRARERLIDCQIVWFLINKTTTHWDRSYNRDWHFLTASRPSTGRLRPMPFRIIIRLGLIDWSPATITTHCRRRQAEESDNMTNKPMIAIAIAIIIIMNNQRTIYTSCFWLINVHYDTAYDTQSETSSRQPGVLLIWCKMVASCWLLLLLLVMIARGIGLCLSNALAQ
jgi:hypothetical protein